MSSRFILPYADVGNGITPEDGAKLYFYETGTSTPKSTYSDEALTTANSNPVISDANGVFGDIWMDGGSKYKVVLQDKNGVQIWEADPVITPISSDSTVATFNTIAELDAASVSIGDKVRTLGYTVAGDGGGNDYTIVAAGTGTADGGTYIDLTESGLQAKGLFTDGTVNIVQYGAVAGGATDNAAALQALVNTIGSGETLQPIVPAGNYLVNTDVTLPSGANVVWYFRAQGEFSGAGQVDQEWNSIRETDFGMSMGGTFYIGKNAGAPTNNDANGGLVFGGYTDRTTEQDSDGIRMEGEGSNSHNLVLYNTKKGGQTQVNLQTQAVWGTCNTSGTAVTRVSGSTFTGMYPKFIVINYVKYEIQSITDDDNLILTTSAGTQSGVKFRIAYVSNHTTANVSGTAVTRVRGELFASSGTVCYVNGVKYSYTYIDGNNITLGASAGVISDADVHTTQNDIGSTVFRLQTQPGGDEQSLVMAYNEEIGYFLSSVVTGTGEHRKLRISLGTKNVEFETDGASQFFGSVQVDGVPKITDPGITLGRYVTGGSHPNANITDNNVCSISSNKSSGGNGGLSIDLYSGGTYSKTPVYYTFSGNWIPGADASYNIGSASMRMNTIYASVGAINTSDGRMKQDVLDLSEQEKEVAIKVKSLIKRFRFKDAVKEKGDKARIHFGVIAQEVGNAFEDVGLDPRDYALFCYDEWDDVLDDKGRTLAKAGDRYGIRYDELLAFVISAL